MVPEGKTLSAKQLDDVAAAVRERQLEVEATLEEENAR